MLIRTCVLAAFILAATVSMAAQDQVFFNHAIAVHGPGLDPVPDQVIEEAKTALNLTDVQVTAVRALLNMRSEAIRQIFQEMEAAQQLLHAAANQTNTNAAEIGTAFLAVQTAHQRQNAAMDKFRTDFKALLNAEQRSVLAALEAAAGQIAGLRALGVLEGIDMAAPIHFGMPGMPAAGQFIHATPGAAIRIERHETGGK